MKKWKTLMIAGMLLTGNAFATDREITFDFNVYSDGADFWVCNSGLQTEDAGDYVSQTDANGDGFVDGTETLDTLGNPIPGTGTPVSDATDTLRGGYDQNLMVSNLGGTQVSGDGTYVYSNTGGADMLAATDAEWLSELAGLSFALGSDLYNAKYFVELCWENSNAYDNIDLGAQLANANFEFLMSSVAGPTYASRAGLETSYSVVCTENDGDVITYPGATNVAAYQDGTATYADADDIPNKCVLRYEFCETSDTPRLDDTAESGDFSVTGRVYFGFDDAVNIPGGI